MRFSYALPKEDDIDELHVIEVKDLDQLIRLCKKMRNKQGYFWPPVEEQLYNKAGYSQERVDMYSAFCKKIQSRILGSKDLFDFGKDKKKPSDEGQIDPQDLEDDMDIDFDGD